ncbi:MAG: NAD(P)H-dependent oxidoreductase [Candidatus Neomarinimicrobiota bacterium]
MNQSQRTKNDIYVVGICGSLRKGSYTRMALNIAMKGAKESAVETRLIDLRDYDLVFCDGKKDESSYPQGVFDLRKDVGQADGIILGTPEYHGGVSGVLKNALDLMGFHEFESKIVGLVGVSGGRTGAVNALNSLRTIGRALHAWVIPDQASVDQAWKAFDDEGNLRDSGLADKIKEIGRQVSRFSYLHKFEKAHEFLKNWECAPTNPGGAREAEMTAEEV